MEFRAAHRLRTVLLAAAGLLALPAAGQAPAAVPPAWAYVIAPPGFKPRPDDGLPVHVPGSTRSYRLPELRDFFLAPDWHPGDHPPMPEVVARGRKPEVFACGFCHRADGRGGPENANLAGLPAAYIVQQMADYRSGVRRTAVPERLPAKLMIALSQAVTPAEVEAAAAYFASIPPQPRLKVFETDTVPGTYVAGFLLAVDESAASEPIGQRIVEVPEDLEQFEHRDSRARFNVYVPVGSLHAGEVLVKSGGDGTTLACGACHGPDLRGVGAIPGIAGRSPSYVVRQLFDIQSGARAGAAVAPMREVVQRLSADDMLAIAAYLATLP